jgi:hypothetical protein
MKKTNLYALTGGVGKAVLFTNLIEDLSKKDKNLISIVSPFFTNELFTYHPLVHSVIDMAKIDHFYNESTFDRDQMSKYFEDIIFFEPYLSNYLKSEQHLIDIWRQGLSLPSTTNTYTDVRGKDTAHHNFEENRLLSSLGQAAEFQPSHGRTQEREQQRARTKAFAPPVTEETQSSQYIIVQLKGGTNKDFETKSTYDLKFQRDYHNTYQLLYTLSNHFKNYHFVVVKTSQDEYDKRLFDIPNIYFVEDIELLDIQHIVNDCLTFISIDSCVQHFAASKSYLKKGIVMWGNALGPRPNTIGHQHNVNLTSEKIDQVYISDETIIKELENIINDL